MAMAPRATLFLAVSLLAMAAVASAHGGSETCPSNLLGFHFTKCVKVLGINLFKINEPHNKEYCCPLIKDLVDLDAAACFCKTLNLPGGVDLTIGARLILNNCGKYCPTDFKCPKPYY